MGGLPNRAGFFDVLECIPLQYVNYVMMIEIYVESSKKIDAEIIRVYILFINYFTHEINGSEDYRMGDEERVVRLLRTITTHLHSCMNRCYEDYGMTGIQGLVLMEVANDEECKLGALAQRLLMTNSNLSAIIKRMEEHGWIHRYRSAHDERIVYVRVSETGTQILRDIKKRMDAQLDFLKQEDEESVAQIIESLKRLDHLLRGESYE